ncbi:hypothetical protein AB0O00_28150, partial [Kitasatospora sp. NPDC093558]
MVDEPNSTPRPAGAEAVPGGHPAGVAALVRLALVLVDRAGRIAQWSRAAEELFGHRAEVARDRPASGLLPAMEPRAAAGGTCARRRCDALDTLAALTADGHPWAGQMPVTDREDHLRDVLWWAYPLPGPSGGLLALAADARPLRTAGPRLALGERLLPFAAAPAARGGFHGLVAALTPPGGRLADSALAAPLARLLPAAHRAPLLAALELAGLPALRLDAVTVLPLLPSDPQCGTAHAAAGIGRRYPTAQQRAARVGAPPQPEQAAAPRTFRGRPAGPLPGQRECAERPAGRPAAALSVPSPTGGGAAIEPAAVESSANGHQALAPAPVGRCSRGDQPTGPTPPAVPAPG